MNPRNLLRIFINLGLFISVLFFPYPVTLALMLLLLFTSRAYEVMLWGFSIDALYGAAVPGLFNVPVVFTLLAFVLFVAVELIKPRLIFYAP